MNIEHIAAVVLVGLIAYKAGQKAATQTTHNEITSKTDWWTYAGSWGV